MEYSQERWSAEEAEKLAPFVTHLTKPIFGLRNLPEVIKGALFSRYSRSEKSLRRVLLDEFMHDQAAQFHAMVGEQAAEEQLLAVQRAEAFYDRVLIGYGDDSVAELGGAHVACEQVSNIAAKALEDSRIGLAPLEKSTRYVEFHKKDEHGRYAYYREPTIMASEHAERYEAALDDLFDTYSAVYPIVLDWVCSQTPQDDQTSQRAYKSATRAKALDLIRGLLPMATLTNVGLFGNGRAFEYLLTKLGASALPELNTIANELQHELDQLIPSFVKRPKTERGAQYRDFLTQRHLKTEKLAREHTRGVRMHPAPTVWLTDYDHEAENKLFAAILYPHSDLPLEQIQNMVRFLPRTEQLELLKCAIGDRKSRFDRPGRPFEQIYYSFDLLADIGVYRDLHRHRMLTQERQAFNVRHGYYLPIELRDAGVLETMQTALEQAAAAYQAIYADLGDVAQYVVPFAYRVRWRMKMNLREAYHLLELRSTRQGHPAYRTIAQEMYRQIRAVHPTLAEGMYFVDLNDYPLERLEAERRIDEKLARSQGDAS